MLISKIISLFVLSLLVFETSANICDEYNEPMSRKDWVLMNMCHYDNTVLVTINNDYLKEWYNPLTHFRTPNIFVYDIEIIEAYKGEKTNHTCMLQSTEASFVISAGKKGTRNIVSYSNSGECIVIEVGAMQTSSPELETYAKEISIEINNEK